ncbi:hypothetical protein G6M89_19835 [Natronolimnobius sp. AArcel1]|uniref:type II toxin-antitoxin system PemK/MazF family toxin n=1 Tax=Natronolimnobius sp. AArcel1 TaxID=1679093 RepID=UPI0013EBA99D|nr:type II toxin-antitoxin system PemK/MazF family toxin [Natronolimnobius sp. AArcel1]NGM71226.1 hypothetical protein [Natronolimnobius sp. AArcel1]
MAVTQGDVWRGPAPHKSASAYRPWLVVSNTIHPFSDEECLTVGMTTQSHPNGIAVPADAWVQAGSKKDAYISPWYVTTIKHRDLENQQGTLDTSLVVDATDALSEYTSL